MQILIPCPLSLPRHATTSETLAPPKLLKRNQSWSRGDIVTLSRSFFDSRGKSGNWGQRAERAMVRATEEGSADAGSVRKRRVVDHICLLKAKEDLSEEEEKDMLDHLYTTQYQMRGILSISLGRIPEENPERYTHAIFMRFQTRGDLAKFYESPLYIGVLKEHVMTYCHVLINLDYETEVEDDILPIFRKGEEFNYGVEFMLLVAFIRSSLGGPAEDAMVSLTNLVMGFPSLIVQATKGSIMNASNKEYTHGVVIRFRSSEAFKMFMRSSEYNNMWKSKFQPIVDKYMSLHFSVDPIGTELM